MKSNNVKSWMFQNWRDSIDENGEICMTHLAEAYAIYCDTDVEDEYFEAAFEVCQGLIKQGVCDDGYYVYPEWR